MTAKDKGNDHLFKKGQYPSSVGRARAPSKISQVLREAALLAAELAGLEIAANQLQSVRRQLDEAQKKGDSFMCEYLQGVIEHGAKYSGLITFLKTAALEDPLDYVRWVMMRMVPQGHEISGPEGEPIAVEDKTKNRPRYESREELLEELRNRGIPIVLDAIPERPVLMKTVRGIPDDN